jgi:hypothetical protein
MAIYLQETEDWAISAQQEYHLEALTRFGERVIIKRRWQTEDHKSGLVSRCSSCADGRAYSIQARVAEVYKQAGSSHCSECYGTGFTSGFMEPSVITYMIATDDPNDIIRQKSGERITEDPNIQLPHAPFVRPGDLLVRFRTWVNKTTPGIEEQRYILDTPSELTVRTGLGIGENAVTVVGFSCKVRSIPAEHAYYKTPL